jgi:hypothetical protein
MRLSSPGPGAARQERTERLRRERATALPLRAMFPGVQQVRLELEFEAAANTPASQAHVLHPPARAFFDFPCPYADCDGHFDLTTVVSGTLSTSAHEAEGVLECAGLRAHGGAKQPCQLQLSYRIIATY